MLSMRSASSASTASSRSSDDRTAKARIRDAAIEAFGERGFDIGLRAIAARAKVSPALVLHHYGSKQRLREACDSRVVALVHQAKTGTLQDGAGAQDRLLGQLLSLERYGPALAYILRSLQWGGEAGRAFFERLVADAEAYLDRGVAQGVIRPSVDPPARARWLAESASGALLLRFTLRHNGDEPVDFAAVLRDWERTTMLPVLELYTDGLLTTHDMLDTYLEYRRT